MIALWLTLALAHAQAVPLAVDALMEGSGADAALRVRVTADPHQPFTLSPPDLGELTAGDVTTREESIGPALVRTVRTKLTVPPGRHVIEGVCAAYDSTPEVRVCADTLYLDVGTKPDRKGMADIVDPRALSTLPRQLLAWIAGVVLLFGLTAWGVRALWRRRPAPRVAEVIAEPAHLVAWRSWVVVRDDRSLSDLERAFALSEIFRAYAEAALAFPARAYSTSETLEHLESLTGLPRTNLPRAQRLLRATDRVKYAEVPPDDHFFAELEDDLRGFIDATRPVSLTQAKKP